MFIPTRDELLVDVLSALEQGHDLVNGATTAGNLFTTYNLSYCVDHFLASVFGSSRNPANSLRDFPAILAITSAMTKREKSLEMLHDSYHILDETLSLLYGVEWLRKNGYDGKIVGQVESWHLEAYPHMKDVYEVFSRLAERYEFGNIAALFVLAGAIPDLTEKILSYPYPTAYNSDERLLLISNYCVRNLANLPTNVKDLWTDTRTYLEKVCGPISLLPSNVFVNEESLDGRAKSFPERVAKDVQELIDTMLKPYVDAIVRLIMYPRPHEARVCVLRVVKEEGYGKWRLQLPASPEIALLPSVEDRNWLTFHLLLTELRNRSARGILPPEPREWLQGVEGSHPPFDVFDYVREGTRKLLRIR